MPKIAAAILMALLLIPTAARADHDFSTIEPDAVCGNVAFYDFDSVSDGPIYYVDLKTWQPICYSGGACRGASRNSAPCQCPMNLWKCPIPDTKALHDEKNAISRQLFDQEPVVCDGIKYYGGGPELDNISIYLKTTETENMVVRCGGRRVYSREPADCPPPGWTCPKP